MLLHLIVSAEKAGDKECRDAAKAGSAERQQRMTGDHHGIILERKRLVRVRDDPDIARLDAVRQSKLTKAESQGILRRDVCAVNRYHGLVDFQANVIRRLLTHKQDEVLAQRPSDRIPDVLENDR
jgi:hypothetical protein